jgi:hypothetical protein
MKRRDAGPRHIAEGDQVRVAGKPGNAAENAPKPQRKL